MGLTAVLHVHSTWSHDGRWSLKALARLYGRLGVRAVMMTEHDTGFDPAAFAAYREACAAASSPRCTLVPGIEYSSPDNAIHVLTWGLDRFLAEGRPVAETLRYVAAAGGAAVLAHPSRRDAWRLYDEAWTPLLSGIELWNRKADGVSWSPEALALAHRTRRPLTVGQDFHRWNQLYPLTQAFPVSPDEPGLEARLVAALRAGLSEPRAFGHRLGGGVERDGRLHPRLEGARRALRRVLRGRGQVRRGREKGAQETGAPDGVTK